jgi:hypothetical protein
MANGYSHGFWGKWQLPFIEKWDAIEAVGFA